MLPDFLIKFNIEKLKVAIYFTDDFRKISFGFRLPPFWKLQ